MSVAAKVAGIRRRQTGLLGKLGGGAVHIDGVGGKKGKEG